MQEKRECGEMGEANRGRSLGGPHCNINPPKMRSGNSAMETFMSKYSRFQRHPRDIWLPLWSVAYRLRARDPNLGLACLNGPLTLPLKAGEPLTSRRQ